MSPFSTFAHIEDAGWHIALMAVTVAVAVLALARAGYRITRVDDDRARERSDRRS